MYAPYEQARVSRASCELQLTHLHDAVGILFAKGLRIVKALRIQQGDLNFPCRHVFCELNAGPNAWEAFPGLLGGTARVASLERVKWIFTMLMYLHIMIEMLRVKGTFSIFEER